MQLVKLKVPLCKKTLKNYHLFYSKQKRRKTSKKKLSKNQTPNNCLLLQHTRILKSKRSNYIVISPVHIHTHIYIYSFHQTQGHENDIFSIRSFENRLIAVGSAESRHTLELFVADGTERKRERGTEKDKQRMGGGEAVREKKRR